MKKISIFLFLMASTSMFIMSCGGDDTIEDACGDAKSYDTDIKPIIDATCSYAGCHIDNDNSSPELTSYELLKTYVDNNQFEMRVLTEKDMPPVDFVPDGKPTELTTAQLETIQCWLDDGAPE